MCWGNNKCSYKTVGLLQEFSLWCCLDRVTGFVLCSLLFHFTGYMSILLGELNLIFKIYSKGGGTLPLIADKNSVWFPGSDEKPSLLALFWSPSDLRILVSAVGGHNFLSRHLPLIWKSQVSSCSLEFEAGETRAHVTTTCPAVQTFRWKHFHQFVVDYANRDIQLRGFPWEPTIAGLFARRLHQRLFAVSRKG